ncbi:formylmethanofuran--tetrahydromethanopterin N-formyltransferase [Candidatus Alkanophaga liquidiphilum]|nr:Formylmethanofuran:tetrahydromethanopterin formyltransferase [Candidatus Alkanophaga liquidiphilum]
MIEDTFCEAFDGLFVRLCVTAGDEELLKRAAFGATALPCTVFGESEGGVECFLSKDETPDGRKGAIIQIWTSYDPKDVQGSVERLEFELSKRVRQGILVVPTTAVFDAPLESVEAKGKIDTMRRIGHCGDGYETVEERHEREVIVVPIMMGEFIIEKQLSYGVGVMGGNVWFFCDSMRSALEAGRCAVAAVRDVKGAITPFDICSAGSKPETKFPEIGPTTNHPFCPTLRNSIPDSKVPEDVASIPEIVINGISLDIVKKAMRATIKSVEGVSGVLKISAGNYGGKLGKYKIYLRELV